VRHSQRECTATIQTDYIRVQTGAQHKNSPLLLIPGPVIEDDGDALAPVGRGQGRESLGRSGDQTLGDSVDPVRAEPRLRVHHVLDLRWDPGLSSLIL
jgi:hypothetical protein